MVILNAMGIGTQVWTVIRMRISVCKRIFIVMLNPRGFSITICILYRNTDDLRTGHRKPAAHSPDFEPHADLMNYGRSWIDDDIVLLNAEFFSSIYP